MNLPATKNIDLGGGITLELVLIPAGQFIMGSEEPAKPNKSVSGAYAMFWLGFVGGGILLLALFIKCFRKRTFSFSLRWLFSMMIASGLLLGGLAYGSLALKARARYETELADFNALPANEKPAHSVTLTQPFYMGKYTVTQEQYSALMGTNPSYFKGARLPVENVSWNDANEFCKKLNGVLKDTQLEAGLPTEAQWEYACRAGTRTRFYTGDLVQDLDAAGWYESNSGKTKHPVGQLRCNAFGLYDMHGNVLQWCQDFYTDSYTAQTTTNPIITQGAARVLRGGSWLGLSGSCRSAFRRGDVPGYPGFDFGFRVVVVPSSRTSP